MAAGQVAETVVASGDSIAGIETPMGAPATSIDGGARPGGEPTRPTPSEPALPDRALPAVAVSSVEARRAKKSITDGPPMPEPEVPRSAPVAAAPAASPHAAHANAATHATPVLGDTVAPQAAPNSLEERHASGTERGGRNGDRGPVREAMGSSLGGAPTRRAFGESLDRDGRQRANQAPAGTDHRGATDRREADLTPWMQSSAAAAVSTHAAAVPVSVISPAGHSAAAQMLAALTIAPAASAAAGTSHTGQPPLPTSDSLLPDTTAQIVQALRLQRTAHGGTAQIRLEPHHFGALNVSIRVDQGQVIARLEAEVPAVREWLQTNQTWLRSSLADQNLTLDRLEIADMASVRDEQRRGEDGSRQHREEQPRPRRRRPETGELFEVVA
jgi:hypothetical protein